MNRRLSVVIREIQYKLQDTFWRNNLIFLAGSLGVGVLNYAYYPLLGHLLSPHQFGDVQVLFVILLDVLVFVSALGMVIINVVVNSPNREAKRLVLNVEQAMVSIFYALFAMWLVFVPSLAGFLRFTSDWPLVILYIVIFITLLFSVRQAFVQGMQDFIGVTIGAFVSAVAKLVLSVILIAAGSGVMGAMLGLALGQLVGVFYISMRGRRRHDMLFVAPWPHKTKGVPTHLRSGLIVSTLIVSLTVTALYSFDTIAVKHYFNADHAGLYAGAATIGRILFFVTVPIATVMFSSVKIGAPSRQNRRVFYSSLAATGILGGTTCLIFSYMPAEIVQLLLGNAYIAAAQYLPIISITIFATSLVNLLLYYGLSLHNRFTGWIALSGLICMIFAIIYYHATPFAIIIDILVVCILLLGACTASHILPGSITKAAELEVAEL